MSDVREPLQNPQQHLYAAIDLKSFYASVECVERGLDALTTHLVVADLSRTEKTICLAVSPALKHYGIPGRARLFEVVQSVEEVNRKRRAGIRGSFRGKSTDAVELRRHPDYALDYIVAPPRMRLYIDYSARVQAVYLDFIAPEDIHVYSVDEVFMDLTQYLRLYKTSARELVSRMVQQVKIRTGITATAGIGTNLFLAKVAMDIEAKHEEPDAAGVRIAQLDEMGFRRRLWCHTPITDFWRVGRGTAQKLRAHGMETMGDVARRSVRDAESLYRLFGVNAELLIDHAWGVEPCSIADIRAYRPDTHSLSNGQVLSTPYAADKARLVVREMADSLALELVEKELVTPRISLSVGYDVENVKTKGASSSYRGPIHVDRYGRAVPKAAHGTQKLARSTNSAVILRKTFCEIFDQIADPSLTVRRLTVVAEEVHGKNEKELFQLELFDTSEGAMQASDDDLAREEKLQHTVLEIKKRFGKNAILRGFNMEDGATARSRNNQIGGHKA